MFGNFSYWAVPLLAGVGMALALDEFLSFFHLYYLMQGKAFPLLGAHYFFILTSLLWFSKKIILGNTDSSDVVCRGRRKVAFTLLNLSVCGTLPPGRSA